MAGNQNASRLVCTFVLLFVCAAALRAGEAIIFSQPDRANFAPSSQPDVTTIFPQSDVSTFRFGPPPPVATPTIIIPRILHGPPPKAERRSLFDVPALFSDPNSSRSEPAPETSKALSPWPRLDSPSSSERDSALYPMRRFYGLEETYGVRTKDSRANVERGDSRLFAGRDQDPRLSRHDALFGVSDREVTPHLTAEERARKEEFTRLLNPTIPSAGSGPRDLDPTDPLVAKSKELPHNAGQLLPHVESQVHSLDPMQKYTDQQRRWSPPSVEEYNSKKVFGVAVAPKPSISPEAVDRRPPLMRQPTIQDFPARRF